MLDKKTRIKLKWHLPAFDYAICLQRKRLYGWKTTSWIYPSIMQDDSCKAIEDWLFWNEKYVAQDQKNIGKELLTKCRW